ncbi:MAG: ChaN family lipoprotein, partial [Proteobacteria bacterium]|nr:ChaN family lipoprotein [Pseudomonadota bacterium]
ALRSRAGWDERWGYDYGLYGPTIDVAVSVHARLLAINAAKELTKKVVRKGLDALTADEKAQVPELNLADTAHRAWFDTLMDDLGGSSAHAHKPPAEDSKGKEAKDGKEAKEGEPPNDADAPKMPTADQIYTVQVIWDETMADTSARWLAANPSGHIVILAGNGHCHDSAIVGRMKRRGVADAISVRPVIEDDEGSVAALLAKPMNDYVIVLSMPPAAPTAPPAHTVASTAK